VPHLIKIAIAENIKAFRDIYNDLLSKEEFQIIINVENGFSLLEKLRFANELPDICLVDLNMPVMNGEATIAGLRKEFPEIGILISSAYLHDYTIKVCYRLGAHGVYDKSHDFSELESAIRQVYSTKFYAPETVSKQIVRAAKMHSIQVDLLSKREKEFLALCIEDLSFKQIASRMNVSENTVKGYQESIKAKTGHRDKGALVHWGHKNGMFPEW
jgi:DNA-binding NarL/FixJ family response regulator